MLIQGFKYFVYCLIFGNLIVCVFGCNKKFENTSNEKQVEKSEGSGENEIKYTRNSKLYDPVGDFYAIDSEEYLKNIKKYKISPEVSKEKLDTFFIEHNNNQALLYKEDPELKSTDFKYKRSLYKLIGVQDSFYIFAYSKVVEMNNNKLKPNDKLFLNMILRYGVNVESGEVLKLSNKIGPQ